MTPRKPQTVFTIVQNWLGLTRYETDQVLTLMDETEPDYDDMDAAQIRALAERAMQCLNENRTLGCVSFNQP